ncbi:putative gap-pol protein [Clonorchis sinensis]|uniref:Putative gap-pol protein n=1 Tax=Clonorchis sinensis TaxID=79923 RepID=G7YWV2_CLOSI|nr:putative gap-pol protein [Clonorchis sinensis]
MLNKVEKCHRSNSLLRSSHRQIHQVNEAQLLTHFRPVDLCLVDPMFLQVWMSVSASGTDFLCARVDCTLNTCDFYKDAVARIAICGITCIPMVGLTVDCSSVADKIFRHLKTCLKKNKKRGKQWSQTVIQVHTKKQELVYSCVDSVRSFDSLQLRFRRVSINQLEQPWENVIQVFFKTIPKPSKQSTPKSTTSSGIDRFIHVDDFGKAAHVISFPTTVLTVVNLESKFCIFSARTIVDGCKLLHLGQVSVLSASKKTEDLERLEDKVQVFLDAPTNVIASFGQEVNRVPQVSTGNYGTRVAAILQARHVPHPDFHSGTLDECPQTISHFLAYSTFRTVSIFIKMHLTIVSTIIVLVKQTYTPNKPSYIALDLATCSHMFIIRFDRVKTPYDGPFRVLSGSEKHFNVQLLDKPVTVPIDRLKPGQELSRGLSVCDASSNAKIQIWPARFIVAVTRLPRIPDVRIANPGTVEALIRAKVESSVALLQCRPIGIIAR